MALPTKGRVIIDTTAGEIDIELWSKETPKTCRNFLALAMEGYYDGVIFHRIVPEFLVQTGDRTGTGAGGESFYGEPFEDEVHPRLRFSHRGLVAMANNGTKNSNDSQFFITLDRADELHGKHTLFGRCVGDTVYNVMKIGESEIDKDERPIYPPKIKSIRILDNPFDDLVPRITAAEKRVQAKAREQAQREREEAERRKGGKKNVKLLSFGEDEAAEEEPVVFTKKNIARPDLVETTATAVSIPDSVLLPKAPRDAKSSANNSKKKDKEVDIMEIRTKHAQEYSSESIRKSEIEKMEADIRKLTKRRAGEADSDEERSAKKNKGPSALEAELAKYSKNRGLHKKVKDGRRKDESDVLAALNNFRGRLKSTMAIDMELSQDATDELREAEANIPEDLGIEVDTDSGFLGHMLHFPKDNSEEEQKAERDYEVIDPRQRNARAKEIERERKKLKREEREGHGGRHRR